MKCPNCGMNDSIEIRPKSFSCTSEGCGFALWKNSLEKLGKAELSDTEATALIAGEKIELKGLTSKAGKKFDCRGELEKWISDDQSKIRWSVKLLFESVKLAPAPAAAVETESADETETETEDTDQY